MTALKGIARTIGGWSEPHLVLTGSLSNAMNMLAAGALPQPAFDTAARGQRSRSLALPPVPLQPSVRL